MSLPVKKIYIDSQFKTSDSVSAAKFTIELPYSITMPHNAIFLIDEICIPHAWYSIEKAFNDMLHIHVLDMSNRQRYSVVLQIPPGNYNGIGLKVALQTQFDIYFPAGLVNAFYVTYDANSFSISISTPVTCPFVFWILSDVEIMNDLRGFWSSTGRIRFGPSFSESNPTSMNDVLRNYDSITTAYGLVPYVSGFLNFNGINNLYLSSPNLGTFTTIGTRGESTIIKKNPASAEFGYMIIDRSASVHDYLECGKCTLKTIDFELKDSRGRYVAMHGANISFSIVFAIKAED